MSKPWHQLTHLLLDTHCHLFDFEDTDRQLERIKEHRVQVHVMTQTPAEFLAIGSRCSGTMIPALGLFPTQVTPSNGDDLLAAFANALPEATIIGEIGLDYVTDCPATRSAQRIVFDHVLQQCELRRLVPSIHARRATADVLKTLRAHPTPAILHWFSGRPDEVAAAPDSVYFSVNHAMLRSRSGRERVAAIPRNQALLETDGPYIQIGGRPAHPLDLRHTAEALARLWELPLVQTVHQLSENAGKLFAP